MGHFVSSRCVSNYDWLGGLKELYFVCSALIDIKAFCNHAELFQKSLTFLDVACSCRAAATSSAVSKSCYKGGKLVVGLVRGDLKTRLAVQLSYVHLPSIAAVEVETNQLPVLVFALRTNELRAIKLSRSAGDLDANLYRGLCLAAGDCRSLRTFSLQHCPLNAENSKTFANWLKANDTLIEFNVVSCSLQENAALILESLAHNSTLKKLDLSGNTMQPTMGPKIKQMLSTNCSVRALHLANNNLRACGAKHVVEALLTNTTLRSLSIASNSLQHNAAGVRDNVGTASSLAAALKDNETIEHIDMLHNDGANLSLNQLCTVLGRRRKPLDIRF